MLVVVYSVLRGGVWLVLCVDVVMLGLEYMVEVAF